MVFGDKAFDKIKCNISIVKFDGSMIHSGETVKRCTTFN